MLTKSYILAPLVLVALVWSVFVAEVRFDFDPVSWGILPRTIPGLLGIVTSPLVHGSWEHLLLNTPPLLVSLMLIGYFYRDIAVKICVLIWITEGVLLWFFGRPVYHIGASGVIYGFVLFILASGLIRHNRRLSVVSLLVILLYGSMIWGIVPQGNNISWESHLFGAISGIIYAIIFRHEGPMEDNLILDDDAPEEDEYNRFHHGHKHDG